MERTAIVVLAVMAIIGTTSALPLSTSFSSLLPYGPSAQDTSMTKADMKKSWIKFDLIGRYRLFGAAEYKSVYVNKNGAISFGGPAKYSSTGHLRNDAIVFAPIWLAGGNGQVMFREVTGTTNLMPIQNAFAKSTTGFYPTSAMIVTCDGGNAGNLFQIILATDGMGRSYVRYHYERLIGNIPSTKNWGIFAYEDADAGATLCLNEVSESGFIAAQSGFIWRTDLPLECLPLTSPCGENNINEEEYNSYEVGNFMETMSVNDWVFYNLHYCLPSFRKGDNTVSIKMACVYEADSYEAMWDIPSPEENKCTLDGVDQFPDDFFSADPSAETPQQVPDGPTK